MSTSKTRQSSRKAVGDASLDDVDVAPMVPLARWLTLVWTYGLYGLFFLLPLFFLRGVTVDAFILPKVTSLRYVTVIAIVALIVRALVLRKATVRPTYLFWPLSAWLLITFLSSVQSISSTRSFFGEYERYDGLLTQASYLVLFLLMANQIDSPAMLRRAVAVAAAGGAVAALIGLMQFAGVPMIDVGELAEFNGRIFGTLGNPGFFGTYMVLSIPLLAAMSVVADSDGRLWWIIGLILSVIGLALSVTIGAWIGFVASVPVLLYAVLRASTGHRLPRWAPGIAVLLALMIGAWALFGLSGPGPQSTDSLDNRLAPPPLATKETTGRIRLLLWQASIEMAADHPLFGTGPNTFQSAVGRYITPELAGTLPPGEDPDRPHNVYLQLLAGTGAAGLLSYLVVLAFFAYLLLRATARSAGADRVLLAGLGSAWVGYLVQDFFLFGVVPTAGFSWLLMGAAAGYADIVLDGKRWTIELPSFGGLRWIGVAAVALVGIWLLWISTLPLIADARARQGADAMAFGDIDRSIAAYSEAVHFAPEQTRYREIYSAALLRAASRTIDERLRQTHLNQALAQIDAAIARDQRYATLYFERAGIFEAIGSSANERAYQDYSLALTLRPFDFDLLVASAGFLTRSGSHDEAIEMARAALRIRPNHVGVAGPLVRSLVALSKEQEAVAAIRPIVAANPRSAAAHFWMAQALEASGEISGALEEYRRALAIDPTHTNAALAFERLKSRR